MTKPLSLKQMALQIAGRKIEQWRAHLESADPKSQFDLGSFNLKVSTWIEKISNITEAAIKAASDAGEWIEIEGEQYLPGDLHIIKQYNTSAAAAPLVESYDKKKSHHIPFEKLFTPSLFPELDYDEVRDQWVILGGTNRVRVGCASPEQWLIHDRIDDENRDAQEKAYEVKIRARNKRKALFKKYGCDSTDALMRKLGLWKK